MFSIIICSINPGFLTNLSKNIKETIGVPYELLPFDNRETKFGICKVYNQQAEIAQYPYLLFIHEDILFETLNWGDLLLDTFKSNENCGLIGLAGSNYKSKMFSGWSTLLPEVDACNIVHKTNGDVLNMIHHRPVKSNLYEAVCLDGVFIASTKEAWADTRFNEEKLKGFHFYDLDFSMRAAFNYNVFVTMIIDVNHMTTTGGDFGNKWIADAFVFHEYLKNFLPYSKSIKSNNKLELSIAKLWLDRLKNEKIDFKKRIEWIRKQSLLSHPSLYYEIIKFLIYSPLKLKGLHYAIKKLKKTS